MKISFLFIIVWSFSFIVSANEMSESDCQQVSEKLYFEMSTGVSGCNTTSVFTSVDISRLVSGKCEVSLSLVEMQTEAECGDGIQLTFKPLMPVAKIKFNKLCKRINFKRSKKYQDKYGVKHIICIQK